MDLYSALLCPISKVLRYDSCVTRGPHSFTCHPRTNHTCIYSPAARHQAGTNLYCLEAHRCKNLPRVFTPHTQPRLKHMTSWLRVQHYWQRHNATNCGRAYVQLPNISLATANVNIISILLQQTSSIDRMTYHRNWQVLSVQQFLTPTRSIDFSNTW